MPPDRLFIEASLADVENAVRFLRELASLAVADFIDDKRASYSAAYALIMAIEGVNGIAAHLIAAAGAESPTGTVEAFGTLHSLGVVQDKELVARLKTMTRFRNLIVHRYWTVDFHRVHDILRSSLDDFGAFAADVERYLAATEA